MSLRGRFLPRFLQLFALTLVTTLAQAQSIRWNPNGGSLALRRGNDIHLVFENCSPEEDPQIPAVDGLQVTGAGRSDQTQIINGKITRSVLLGFAFRPTEEKTVVIPEFSVKTDQGVLRVPATTFSVASPNAGKNDGSVALEDVAQARFEIPAEVYAGQIFPLKYVQTTIRRYFSQWGSDLRWDSSPLTLEDWQPPVTSESMIKGERTLVLNLETRAIAPAGDIALKPGTQLINLITGASSGFFFNSNVEQFSITTQPATIRVKPLPPGAPSSFAGAVGQFTLNSKAVPAQARVGEPVTWTLSLSGNGNWPAIQALPAREVSTQFKAVQAEPKRTLKPGRVFEGTLDEDVVLIPQEPGSYSFGPYTYTYFDPEKAQYVTRTTPAHSVTVLPANAPVQSNLGGAGAGSDDVRLATPAPGLPAPVPGDTVRASAGARAPLSRGGWLAWCVLPGAGLLVAWGALAVRRALQLDPEAPRRRARAAALDAIRDVAGTEDPAARRRGVARWQVAVAGEQGLPRAYPGLQIFTADEQGRKLWAEAEAFLFAEGGSLPADWVSRAQAHIETLPKHAFAVTGALRGSAWLPCLLGVLALALLAPQAGAADAGEAAYKKGDYLGAEAAWRTALEKTPTSAALHLNLSLALSQQGAWGEATAHATLAFIQDPSSEAARRQLRYLAKRPTFTPQQITELAAERPGAAFLRLATPHGWQLATAGALGLLALGALLALLHRHGVLRRAWLAAAWLLAISGALVLPATLYGYFGYGLLRHEGAALVWRETALYSVPTAADAEQQKSNIAPGTLALRGRTFLSWTELTFADGQKGWVQTADLLGVWRP